MNANANDGSYFAGDDVLHGSVLCLMCLTSFQRNPVRISTY